MLANWHFLVDYLSVYPQGSSQRLDLKVQVRVDNLGFQKNRGALKESHAVIFVDRQVQGS